MLQILEYLFKNDITSQISTIMEIMNKIIKYMIIKFYENDVVNDIPLL